MSQTIQAGENRIDRPSQIILGALNTDEWMFGEPLRDAAELGQNQQVFYRMDTHLLPAGLVEEKPRADRPPGREQARQFRLTDRGAEWVDHHAAQIARPATREETQQIATQARDDAASAKASVQNYRKKLSRMKAHLGDLGDEIAEIDRRHAHDYEEVQHLGRVGEKAHSRAHENQRAIHELREQLDKLPSDEAVEALRDELTTTQAETDHRLEDIEQQLNDIIEYHANSQRSRAGIRQLATWAGIGAAVIYLFVFLGTIIFAPGLLATVLIGGLCGIFGIAIGTSISASAIR